MFFENLLEFHPATAVHLTEVVCLIAVILFAVIFRRTFQKISENFLVSVFAISRLPDMLLTIFCFKKVDYSHEAGFLRQAINVLLSNEIVVLLFNVAIILIISYLFLYKAWHHSGFSRTAIRIGILTFSLVGILWGVLNAIFYLNL